MENLGIFYDHLVYFTAIGNILGPFGIFYGDLVYFPTFWYFGPRKIRQPWAALALPCFASVSRNIVHGIHKKSDYVHWGQSYDFRIYSYNASVVVG
jgi:hypothetical protein